MQKIKLLSQKEILKIAAGQVVDRPANVVKELIENSVDAGATKITVYIQDGGKDLIRVVDNGCGMSADDAKFCFTKHSTSKITNLDELSTGLATTFGFRGEALASIAAIAKVTLTTKDAQSENGTILELENSDFVSEKEIPFECGTDLKIKDLFYNTPARQKFLKKRESENRHITQLFQAFCLDYLDINFKLFIDGRQTINCPATDCLIKRAAQVWDHSFSQNLLLLGKPEFHHPIATSPIIYGAITNHQYYRYDRNNIFLFVNKRWVKNHEIQSALLKGYINVLPAAKYPAAFIFVEIDPAQIDVNTHPRKEEVKFLHPRIISGNLQEFVRQALQNNLSSQIKQSVNFRQDVSFKQNVDFRVEKQEQSSYANHLTPTPVDPELDEGQMTWATEDMNFEPKKFTAGQQEPNFLHKSEFYDPSINSLLRSSGASKGTAGRTLLRQDFVGQAGGESLEQAGKQEQTWQQGQAHETKELTSTQKQESQNYEFFEQELASEQNFISAQQFINAQEQELQENQKSLNIITQTYNIIGQYNKTYILIEKENGLFFIDQHAAHERVLYEIFSQRFENVATIRLLFPQLITLKAEDISVVEPNLSIFKQNGIEIETFGENQLKIQATPVHIKNINLQELILEVISWIKEFQELDKSDFFKKINEKMHAQMACKAAIKAGDTLTIEQMEKLLQDLDKTENRFACPHGRPTGWILTLDEIEKKFRRKL